MDRITDVGNASYVGLYAKSLFKFLDTITCIMVQFLEGKLE